MKVMFTVLYLTLSINSMSLSQRPCSQDSRSLTMEEVESVVYALASEKGVPMTVILNRLLRKARIRQRTEKEKSKTLLQEIALQELINSESLPRNPPISSDISSERTVVRPPIKSKPHMPPSLSVDRNSVITGMIYAPQIPQPNLPRISHEQARNVMTGVLLPPGFPQQLPSSVPQSLFIPFPNLSPPPGVTIRVKAGVSSTIPEVTVTLSPLMTIVEALKQADSKFRSVLGLSPVSDDEVISFSYSPYAECYVIQSFDNIESTESGYWKIIVNDMSGKVIYDSECLPSRNEVAVKPGMTITLLYTVI